MEVWSDILRRQVKWYRTILGLIHFYVRYASFSFHIRVATLLILNLTLRQRNVSPVTFYISNILSKNSSDSVTVTCAYETFVCS